MIIFLKLLILTILTILVSLCFNTQKNTKTYTNEKNEIIYEVEFTEVN